jgi:hypothetical protein
MYNCRMQLLHREVQDVHFAFRRLIFNYRGITVLPVISKIVEAVIRDRIQPLIHNMQNPTQRGFTKGSSPMNAALPVSPIPTSCKRSNSGLIYSL